MVQPNVLTTYQPEMDGSHTISIVVVGLPSLAVASQVKDWVQENAADYLKKNVVVKP